MDDVRWQLPMIIITPTNHQIPAHPITSLVIIPFLVTMIIGDAWELLHRVMLT